MNKVMSIIASLAIVSIEICAAQPTHLVRALSSTRPVLSSVPLAGIPAKVSTATLDPKYSNIDQKIKEIADEIIHEAQELGTFPAQKVTPDNVDKKTAMDNEKKETVKSSKVTTHASRMLNKLRELDNAIAQRISAKLGQTKTENKGNEPIVDTEKQVKRWPLQHCFSKKVDESGATIDHEDSKQSITGDNEVALFGGISAAIVGTCLAFSCFTKKRRLVFEKAWYEKHVEFVSKHSGAIAFVAVAGLLVGHVLLASKWYKPSFEALVQEYIHDSPETDYNKKIQMFCEALNKYGYTSCEYREKAMQVCIAAGLIDKSAC